MPNAFYLLDPDPRIQSGIASLLHKPLFELLMHDRLSWTIGLILYLHRIGLKVVGSQGKIYICAGMLWYGQMRLVQCLRELLRDPASTQAQMSKYLWESIKEVDGMNDVDSFIDGTIARKSCNRSV